MTEATEIASRKKRRLYLLLLIFQVLVVFYPMFMHELIDQQRTNIGFGFVALTHTVIVIILIVVNALFIREFIKSKKVFYLVCIVYGISFVISAVLHAVPQIAGNNELTANLNALAVLLLIGGLSFTFYASVKDIFRLKHDLTYSLLGAANIFLLIGAIFAFIVNFCGSVFPNMVVPPDQIIMLDNQSNLLSYYTLASVDLPFENVNPFIRNILVVESIFSHLFVVMIVGRLLSK